MLTRLFEGSIDRQSVLLALALTIVMAGWRRGGAWVRGRGTARMARDKFRESTRSCADRCGCWASRRSCWSSDPAVPRVPDRGTEPRTGVHLRNLADWAFSPGLNVLLIVILAYTLMRMTALLVHRFEHEMNVGTGLDALERGKRARTLGRSCRTS